MGRASLGTLLLLCVAACTHQPPLVDERTAPPYQSLLAQAADYTRTTERVPAGAEPSGGLHMQLTHVASPAPEGRLVVLVHGMMAASYTWRFVEGPLGARNDLLLVDLPGCGGSDKPEYTRAGRDTYSQAWMAAHLLRAVDRFCKARGDTRKIVFVGHSLGGSAILRAVTDPRIAPEAPDVVARVERLVLISTPDVAIDTPSESIKTLHSINQPLVDVALTFGFFDTVMADAVRQTVLDPTRDALHQELCHFGTALARCRTRRAGHGMLLRFNPVLDDGVTIDAAERARLEDCHRAHRGPVLLITGDADDVVRPENGDRIAARLPDAERVRLRAKHSVQQERARDVAAHIQRFMDGTP